MPSDKITNKISELQTNFSSEQLKCSTIFQTINSLKLASNFKEFNSLKQQGYTFDVVLSVLIWIVLRSKTTVNSALSELSDYGINIKKDV